MTDFQINQDVWYLPKKCWANLVYFDESGYAEIEFRNGATTDTTLASLKHKSPAQEKQDAEALAEEFLEAVAQKYIDYISENDATIITLAKTQLNVARIATATLGCHTPNWDELTSVQKLNVIAITFNTTPEVIIEQFAKKVL